MVAVPKASAPIAQALPTAYTSSTPAFWIDPAVGHRRSRHEDLADARHPRRDGAHEHRGYQGRLAAFPARDINSDSFHWLHQLAQHGSRTVEAHKAGPELAAMKRFDLGCRTVQGPQKSLIRGRFRRRHLAGPDLEVLRTIVWSVKAAGILHQGLVSAGLHVFEDPADSGVLSFREGKPAGGDARQRRVTCR